MQQWAAASIARREGLQYFTFGESYQGADLEGLIRRCSEIAQARQLVVGTNNVPSGGTKHECSLIDTCA